MSLSSLLLSRPIPRDSVELGRLVLDPKYPDQDFCQPSFPSQPDDVLSPNATKPSFDPDVATQRFENFQDIVQRARGTRLELNLTQLLSTTPWNPVHSSSVTVTSPLCEIHQLRNSSAYFNRACQLNSVREWVLTDARVELARQQGKDVNVAASVPAASIACAAGVPVPPLLDSGLDVGGSLSLKSDSSENLKFTASGEHVFAVQYRKISFSWFSSQKVDKAYLEKGNRWKSYLSTRAGQSGEDEIDGVSAEVAGPILPSDLIGIYDDFELDGEQLLYRID
ncbi:hypothetical protein IL306_013446 [Fusarium sp. DS 682]|nr:hypothetical protein IL306_013446 [Fusarium sp. DS 682]